MTNHKALVERLRDNKWLQQRCGRLPGEAADAIERLAALNELPDGYDIGDDATAELAVELASMRERAERYKAALVGARDIFEAGNVHAAYVIVHGALKETDT